jgi:hypothetical protein
MILLLTNSGFGRYVRPHFASGLRRRPIYSSARSYGYGRAQAISLRGTCTSSGVFRGVVVFGLSRLTMSFLQLGITFFSELLSSQFNDVIGPIEVRPLSQILDSPLCMSFVFPLTSRKLSV